MRGVILSFVLIRMIMCKQWNQVTVVGCGLLGASFALALRDAGVCDRISGWDTSPDVLKRACDRGIIDEVDLAFDRGGQSSSDLIYLATPIKAIISFFEERTALAKPGCVITDAGSTKLDIWTAAHRHLPPDVKFIGGHPMAGGHRGGLEHARRDLFRDAPYLLIPQSDCDANDATKTLRFTLSAIGAHVEIMTPEKHDRAMAFVSHLPQLLSSALADTVKHQTDHECLTRVAGSAYKDLTRLSSSPWNIWRDILTTNSGNIDDALAVFIDRLQQVRSDLKATTRSSHEMLDSISALFAGSS